jgi:hypothetical protein
VFNFTNIYFDYHIIVKFYRVHDLNCGFDGLRCKIQVNLIYYHFNIKKNIILNFLKVKSCILLFVQIIFELIKLIISCQCNFYEINFKLKLNKDTKREFKVDLLNCF